MKECIKCNVLKSLGEFRSRQSKCISCQNDYLGKYYENKKDIIKQNISKRISNLPAGVYMVKCLINGKRYIGQSVKPYRRKTEHFSKLKYTRLSKPELQKDLLQYGKQAFVFGVIEHCNTDVLLEREKHYIDVFKPEYN
jgi:hypothetical protein